MCYGFEFKICFMVVWKSAMNCKLNGFEYIFTFEMKWIVNNQHHSFFCVYILVLASSCLDSIKSDIIII